MPILVTLVLNLGQCTLKNPNLMLRLLNKLPRQMALTKIRLRQDMGNVLKGLHANFGWARPKFEASLCLKTRTVGINY